MKEKIINEKFSGYYCRKCNCIPLIQIIPKEKNIKIFSSCKCRKQYEDIDSFIKNKYQKNIVDINQISKNIFINNNSTKFKEKVDINSILENFTKSKEIMNENGINIKNQIIEIYKKRIEDINELYENYVKKNNKIILIIEQMIKSYNLIKDNPSNILNILNNCSFNKKSKTLFDYNYVNIDSLFRQVETYFYNEYIISSSSIKEGFENNYFSFNNYSVNSFIELEDNICASCLNNQPNIVIYDLNNLNKEKISFNAHFKVTNWIIKSNRNNLISCGNDGIIKIWPPFNEKFLLEEKNFSINIDKDNLKKYNIKNLKIINLNAIYEYISKNEEMKNIIKMISLRENKFLAASKRCIFLYKYLIEENIVNIELINKYTFYDLSDIYVIEKDKNEIIAMNTHYYLYFLTIPNFEIIYKVNIRMIKNSLIQLNSDEILINELNYLTIIDINKLKIKLKVKNNNSCDFILNMNDGTVIQNNYYGIKRIFIKTMEELPILMQLNNDEYDEYYDYYYNNDDHSEKIVFIYKLRDGRIILCYQNGRIDLCNLKFI